MKVYTRTGDAGQTSLFSGQRVSKSHPLVAAYGGLDEMNSILGVALAAGPSAETNGILLGLQCQLFDLGADLATLDARKWRIAKSDTEALEREIDRMQAVLPQHHSFILPGGTPAAAQIHVARTVCRRVERDAVAAAVTETVSPDALVFINRLSDFLFVLARHENHVSGCKETVWTPVKVGSPRG
jgi:cob(I)alamin adenosyltransferase